MAQHDHNIHPKPYEKTPKPVKNVMIAAVVLYVLGVLLILGGCAEGDGEAFGGGIVMLVLGVIAHKAGVPIVKWYTTG